MSSKETNLKLQQAIFLSTGPDTTKQYLEVLKYCKKLNLPIVNVFIEQSDDEQKLYKVMNDTVEFADRQKVPTAIVIANKDVLPNFIKFQDIPSLIIHDHTELHIVEAQAIFSR